MALMALSWPLGRFSFFFIWTWCSKNKTGDIESPSNLSAEDKVEVYTSLLYLSPGSILGSSTAPLPLTCMTRGRTASEVVQYAAVHHEELTTIVPGMRGLDIEYQYLRGRAE